MEKIFNPNSSGKSAPSNNIDNIIYNSNNIYNKATPFTNLEYYMLSNLIISEAAKKYNTEYNSNLIPLNYVAFYYKEISKYINAFTPALKKFLKAFSKKGNNLSEAIRIFQKTFSNDITIKSIKKASLFSGVKPGEYIECSKSFLSKKVTYDNVDNPELKQALSNINQIAAKIDKTSYDKNLKYLYLDFLASLENRSEKNEKENENEAKPLQDRRKQTIVTPPKEVKQERISSIKLPKLKIGRIFPTSFTHSRIDSAYFVYKFVEGYRAFAIVEKYHFKSVKYTDGFEKKRRSLFETKKSDFDLF